MYFVDRKMPKEKNVIKKQERLCNLIVLSGYLCIVINLIALVGVWVGIVRPAHLSYTTYYYWMHYIVIPCVLLLVVVGAVDIVVRNVKVPLVFKQYSVLLLLVFCLSFITAVHKIALVMLASFAIPVFVSTVFSKPKMTRNIFLICIGVIIACTFFILPDISARIESGYIWVEMVTALAIVSSAYVFSRIQINFYLENLSELKASYETQSRMHSMIQSDCFTGLYNRSTFDELLSTCVGESCQTKEPVALVLIDLDHFKAVNDTFCHAKGDKVLLYFSQLLKGREGQNVYAFRFGGDEFALLFKGEEYSVVKSICEKLRMQYAQDSFATLGLNSSFSCGIASFDVNMKNIASLFEAADRALYVAKQQGRNQTVFAENILAKVPKA
jgi:diguanylate cyclase (GGDEF)-like protein